MFWVRLNLFDAPFDFSCMKKNRTTNKLWSVDLVEFGAAARLPGRACGSVVRVSRLHGRIHGFESRQ